MSTDANAVIELLEAPAGHRAPYAWAEIHLRRDYALFDLLAGGRSDDPDDAVVAPRSGSTVETWLWASDLEKVAVVYREREGRSSHDLDALLAVMRALNAGADERTRVVLRFF